MFLLSLLIVVVVLTTSHSAPLKSTTATQKSERKHKIAATISGRRLTDHFKLITAELESHKKKEDLKASTDARIKVPQLTSITGDPESYGEDDDLKASTEYAMGEMVQFDFPVVKKHRVREVKNSYAGFFYFPGKRKKPKKKKPLH